MRRLVRVRTVGRVARRLRLQFAGGIYHVTSRSVEGRLVLASEHERRKLEDVIGKAVDRHRWFVLTHCLMGNHYHLVVETPEPTLAAGMHLINGSFAQFYNYRRRRAGHVFEARYHSELIMSEVHLLEAYRYVVLNPVRARLCEHPADWPWSSYRALAGLAKGPPFLDVPYALRRIGLEGESACTIYREFVLSSPQMGQAPARAVLSAR